MKHFDISDWANFVRSVEVGIDRAAMNRHLSSGCARCGRMVAVLRRTADLVRIDAAFEPSADDVRRALVVLASQPAAKVHLLDRLVPRLIYDSLREPLPVGVRARHRLSRQVLYRAGDFYVDLKFEQAPNARRVRLLGQVANRRDPAWFASAGPILLRSGRRTVRRTSSNEFHEFQIEYEPRPGLQLVVPIPGARTPIEVSLEKLITAVPHGEQPTIPEPHEKQLGKTRPGSKKASRQRWHSWRNIERLGRKK